MKIKQLLTLAFGLVLSFSILATETFAESTYLIKKSNSGYDLLKVNIDEFNPQVVVARLTSSIFTFSELSELQASIKDTSSAVLVRGLVRGKTFDVNEAWIGDNARANNKYVLNATCNRFKTRCNAEFVNNERLDFDFSGGVKGIEGNPAAYSELISGDGLIILTSQFSTTGPLSALNVFLEFNPGYSVF